jgi:ParB-like chromosome segregation protein Spo0J
MGARKGLSIEAKIRSIEDLIPYDRNPRTHSRVQVEQLAASIREWGWTMPVLADGDGIVAGHGRLMAARQIYEAGGTIRLPSGDELPQGTVPVIDCTGWSEEQRRAYVVADNQLPLNAGWDEQLLAGELDALQGMEFNLDLLGFAPDELSKLLGGEFDGSEEEEEEDRGMDQGMALAIVLTPQEMKAWRRAKEEIGYSTDKAAFWKLVQDLLQEVDP